MPRGTAAPLLGLVARLSEGGPGSEERVRRTLELLSRDYRYTLRVGRSSSSQPLVEFLLDKKIRVLRALRERRGGAAELADLRRRLDRQSRPSGRYQRSSG